MKNLFLNKRAETILEVTLALFVVGIAITTSSMIIRRSLDVTAQNKLFIKGVLFAKEGIEGVRNIRDTNWLRYPDEECWKTLETSDVCTPSSSPMMANGLYSIYFDHIDFTWDLTPAIPANFEDTVVLSRVANEFSIHELFLSEDQISTPIYVGENTVLAKNTYFYRGIEIELSDDDIDNQGDGDDEIINVTSTVKWPYKNKVKSYSITKQLMNIK